MPRCVKHFLRAGLWACNITRSHTGCLILIIPFVWTLQLSADELTTPPVSSPGFQDAIADLPEVKVALHEVETIFSEAQRALNSYATKGRIKSPAALMTQEDLDNYRNGKQPRKWNTSQYRFYTQEYIYLELHMGAQTVVDSLSASLQGLSVPESPEDPAEVYGSPEASIYDVRERKREWVNQRLEGFDEATSAGERCLERLGSKLSHAHNDKSAPDSGSYSDWLNSYSKENGRGPSVKGSEFAAQSANIRKIIATKLGEDYDKARLQYFESEAEARRSSMARAKAHAEDHRKARLEADASRAKELQSLDSNDKKAQYLLERCTWREELPDFVVQNFAPLRHEIVVLVCREMKPNLRDDKIGVSKIPAERSRLLELCAFGIADPPLPRGVRGPRSEAPNLQALEGIKKCLAIPETQFGACNVLAHLSLHSEQIVHWTRGNLNLASSEQEVAYWNAALKTLTRKHLLRIFDHFTAAREELLVQEFEAAKPQIQWDLFILAQMEDFKADGIRDMETEAKQTRNFYQAAGIFTWGIEHYLTLLKKITPGPPAPAKSEEQLRTEELWETAIAGIDLGGRSFQFFRSQVEAAEFNIIRLQEQLGPDPVYEFETRTFGGEFGMMMATSAIQGGIMAKDRAIQRDIDAMIGHYNTSVQLLLFQRDAMAYQKLPADQQKLVDKYDLRTKAFADNVKATIDPSKLAGQWQYSLVVYTFNANGEATQRVGGIPAEPPLPNSWRIDGDRLTMRIRSGFDIININWTVKSLTEDELTIAEEGRNGTVTLKRVR